MNPDHLMETSFRAIPTTPVVKPAAKPEGILIDRPTFKGGGLPRKGQRKYLAAVRKIREKVLARAGIGNRAMRRLEARSIRFVKGIH